jgi:predicted DNA-binding WGR domain protein
MTIRVPASCACSQIFMPNLEVYSMMKASLSRASKRGLRRVRGTASGRFLLPPHRGPSIARLVRTTSTFGVARFKRRNINHFFESDQHDRFKFCVGRRAKLSRRFGMSHVSEHDSSSLYIVLERVDPARNIARYYVLSIEPTLFSKHTLIRRWGRIGSFGRERLQFFGGENASQAHVTLETWLARKRKRGYAPRSEPASPALLFHKRVSC